MKIHSREEEKKTMTKNDDKEKFSINTSNEKFNLNSVLNTFCSSYYYCFVAHTAFLGALIKFFVLFFFCHCRCRSTHSRIITIQSNVYVQMFQCLFSSSFCFINKNLITRVIWRKMIGVYQSICVLLLDRFCLNWSDQHHWMCKSQWQCVCVAKIFRFFSPPE